MGKKNQKHELTFFLIVIALLPCRSFQTQINIYVLNGSQVMLSCDLEDWFNISWNLPSGDVLCDDGSGKTTSDILKHIFVSTHNSSAVNISGFTSELVINDVTSEDEGVYTCTVFPNGQQKQYHVIVVESPPSPYQCHILQEGTTREVICASEYIDLNHFKFVLKVARTREKSVTIATDKQPRFQLDFRRLATEWSQSNVSLVLCVVHVNLPTAQSCGRPLLVGQGSELGDSTDQSTTLYVAISVSVCLATILIAVGIVLAVYCRRRRSSLKTDTCTPSNSTIHKEVIPVINTSSSIPESTHTTHPLPEEQSFNRRRELPLTNSLNSENRHLTTETDSRPLSTPSTTSISMAPLASEEPSLEQSVLSAYKSLHENGAAVCSLTDDQKRQSLELTKLRDQNLWNFDKNRDSIRLENSPVVTYPTEQLEAGLTTDCGHPKDKTAALHYYKFPKSSELKTESFPLRIKSEQREIRSGPCCFDDKNADLKPAVRNGYECLHMNHTHNSPHFPNFHVCPRHFRRKLDVTDRSQSTFSLQFVHRLDQKGGAFSEIETDDVWRELPPDLKVVPPDLDLPPKLPRKTKSRSSFLLADLPNHEIIAERSNYAVPRITTARTLAELRSFRSRGRSCNEAPVKRDEADKTKTRFENETNHVAKKQKMSSQFAGGALDNNLNRNVSRKKHNFNRQMEALSTTAQPRGRRQRSNSLNTPRDRMFKRYWNKGELLRPWNRSSTTHHNY